MIKIIITIDEMKPHWAIEQKLDEEAKALGILNVVIVGSHDRKITYIKGDVHDFDEISYLFKESKLGQLGRIHIGS